MPRREFMLEDSASKSYVTATLVEPITLEHVQERDRRWPPVLNQAQNRIRELGGIVELSEDLNWNWRQKYDQYFGVPNPEKRGFALICAAEVQGLIIVSLDRQPRLPPDLPTIPYVEFIEVAPWNRGPLMAAAKTRRRFGDVGVSLLEAVKELSVEEGCDGRFGLHSLRGVESWYGGPIGMQPVKRDADYDDLLYFEMTTEGAKRFRP